MRQHTRSPRSRTSTTMRTAGRPSPSTALATGLELARRAVAMDDQEPDAHFALGMALMWSRRAGPGARCRGALHCAEAQRDGRARPEGSCPDLHRPSGRGDRDARRLHAARSHVSGDRAAVSRGGAVRARRVRAGARGDPQAAGAQSGIGDGPCAACVDLRPSRTNRGRPRRLGTGFRTRPRLFDRTPAARAAVQEPRRFRTARRRACGSWAWPSDREAVGAFELRPKQAAQPCDVGADERLHADRHLLRPHLGDEGAISSSECGVPNHWTWQNSSEPWKWPAPTTTSST